MSKERVKSADENKAANIAAVEPNDEDMVKALLTSRDREGRSMESIARINKRLSDLGYRGNA